MSTPKIHLGWFTSFRPPVWTSHWTGSDADTWADGRFHVEMARALERAGFDYLMLEDSSMVSDIYGGTTEFDLAKAQYAPKHDPVALVPMLAAATTRLGIVTTMSTSFYPPYLLARVVSTMDHMSHGRVGWNVVTSSEDRAAQNFGMDALPPHDERYERAEEFVGAVDALWTSWEPDALVMNQETHVYVDHTKVHDANYVGKYHRTRGPLNTLPMPQGRPVICQAGGSPRGRAFAAQNADTIICQAQGIEAMKAYRDDVRAMADAAGRDPNSIKILYIVSPVLGETDREAKELDERSRAATDGRVHSALAHISAVTGNDLSTLDIDAPPPELTTNGHRTTLADFLAGSGGSKNNEDGTPKTLRQLAATWSITSVPLVGTPDTVAGQMEDVIDAVGGDGFLMTGRLGRRYYTEVTDGLVPALQRRGLVRTAYAHEQFRDNLLDF
ncbi:dibenzothiophene desulfurization enzyme A [Rhodococcoides trifolii]|uniref:Dibenzothiophene desulfurization enzyme A n=1 Tax=Rhodococcoides trifolii TaxID=908250 RepID=A0A917G3G8_9NOCA|nr:NtaA/DmoA family FMN-dependent monooxygenase [Rhodococcus trifolii]GGG21237.1 dibenzothiophene desulfurization enzyme A [Rhodococcus trifolii]